MNEKLPVAKTAKDLFLGSLRNCYDHVAYTFVIGFFWSLATIIVASGIIILSIFVRPVTGSQMGQLSNVFPLMITAMVGGVSTGALIWGPLNCGLIHLAYKVQDGTAHIRELWNGIRAHYALASRVYAVYFIAVIFLAVDILVAFTISVNSLFMKIAGISAMYFLIYLVLMGFYIPGLIAFQEKNTVAKIFRKSYLLTLDNGLINLAAGVILVAVTAIMVTVPLYIKPLSFFFVIYTLLFGGFMHYLLSKLYHTVITRYDD